MTADNRQPKGIPVGGQFAASTHEEPGVTLAHALRPELAGWPEALYPPTVSFRVSDEGKIITETTDISGDFIQVWEKDDGSGGYDGHALGEWDGASDEDIEQAQEWLTERHKVIAAAVRAEEAAAVDRARARILAAAMGEAKPATDDVAATLKSNGASADEAPQDAPQTPFQPEPAAGQNLAEEGPCSDGPWCTAPRGKHIDGCSMESF